ncbi:MAG: class II aldolase/adducin family protein [Desulfobacterota bacterium]|nr:class II aldolase/adducin family protein [Thermodesulfobacteriota bacterium]
MNEEKGLKQEIIALGKKLYHLRLVVARGGNLSSQIDADTILITATGVSLGELTEEDIIKINLMNPVNQTNKKFSTEFPLHSMIYKNFPEINRVIHCHPPLTNAYFAVHDDLDILTFETRLFLGKIPVVKQITPNVTNPEEVIAALKLNNLVAIKNHGVVSMGENFSEALFLVESLEEAVKMSGVARLFKKEALSPFEEVLKKELFVDTTLPREMFSWLHIQAIVDLVNQDEILARLGNELDLTVAVAIELKGEIKKAYTFHFEKGKIIKVEPKVTAPWVISAAPEIWKEVFLGRLDPFVATTQKKMELSGELSQLARWYVPFSRLFEIFRQVKINY